ncbi:MAG TPA: hypothetical protein VHA09_04620 [Nitrososphaera sp.]|nr:hypothetical protein [Nitrososphaera sp.]
MQARDSTGDGDTEIAAPHSSSGDRFSPEDVRQALDKALDNFGPKMKPVIWGLLEKRSGNPSFEERAPTLLELEVALRSILGDTAYIVLDWILDELENDKR